MIGIILALLSFLISATGLFVFLLGVLSFIIMFIVPQVLGVGRKLSNLYIWLSLWCMQRAAIVVSEHGELLYKSMSFDDLGVEKISFGTDTKDFEDPATALHHWANFPFAIADEVHGVLFDPRHAAIAEQKREYDEQDMGSVKASENDWNAYGIDEWVPGVFEIPKRHQLVDLSAIRHIIDGGERAEYPKRIEELYQKSRLPYSSAMPSLRLLVPVGAFVGVIILFWQIGSSDGGSGGSTIGYGALLLLTTGATLGNLKYIIKHVLAIVPVPLLFIFLAVVINPIFAIVAFVTFALGFSVIPFLTLLARPSSKLSSAFAGFYLRLGLLGYNRPVLEWTPSTYRLREFDDLDREEDTVKWYTLAGSLLGFTFDPSRESFDAEVLDREQLQTSREVATDGGKDTSLPAGYVRCPSLKRDIYGGFVPKNLKPDTLYLHSGIALGRMTDAAIGEKSLRTLLKSKEKYGGVSLGVSDKTLLWATMGSIVLGSAIGIFLFML